MSTQSFHLETLQQILSCDGDFWQRTHCHSPLSIVSTVWRRLSHHILLLDSWCVHKDCWLLDKGSNEIVLVCNILGYVCWILANFGHRLPVYPSVDLSAGGFFQKNRPLQGNQDPWYNHPHWVPAARHMQEKHPCLRAATHRQGWAAHWQRVWACVLRPTGMNLAPLRSAIGMLK